MTPSPLPETFERVVVINLARRTDRLADFTRRICDWPFKAPTRFEAVDGSTLNVPAEWKHGRGALGCFLSHRAVLGAAVADSVSSLLVLEDDACPVPNFTDRSAEFLSRVPPDWQCLMFGAEHLSPPVRVGRGIVQCTAANRAHAYSVRGPMMDGLLKMWNHFDTDHCDVVLASLMTHFKTYAPDPLLIGQGAGFSDITEQIETPRFLSPM